MKINFCFTHRKLCHLQYTWHRCIKKILERTVCSNVGVAIMSGPHLTPMAPAVTDQRWISPMKDISKNTNFETVSSFVQATLMTVAFAVVIQGKGWWRDGLWEKRLFSLQLEWCLVLIVWALSADSGQCREVNRDVEKSNSCNKKPEN